MFNLSMGNEARQTGDDEMEEIKIQAEIAKLIAETAKIQAETRLYPFIVSAGLIGAGAALAKIFLA